MTINKRSCSINWINNKDIILIKLDKDYVFIVDPIDGTRSFIDGHENYACALGIAFKGVMKVAAVQMPSLEQTFWASVGSGAYQNGKRINVSCRSDVHGSSILTAKPNLDSVYWPIDRIQIRFCGKDA